MKIFREKYKRQLGNLEAVTEKIAILQYSGKDIKFRRKSYVRIPPAGFESFAKRDKWLAKLLANKNRYFKYQSALKKLADSFGFTTKDEIKTLEDYLQMGEPIISYSDHSRIKIKTNQETHEMEAWIRVDGLSPSQIIELAEEIKEEKPALIKNDLYKLTGKRENLLLHKRIYELRQTGKSTGEIVQLITKVVHELVPKEYQSQAEIPSEGSIRQIVSRYPKRMREKLAKRDKLKSKV